MRHGFQVPSPLSVNSSEGTCEILLPEGAFFLSFLLFSSFFILIDIPYETSALENTHSSRNELLQVWSITDSLRYWSVRALLLWRTCLPQQIPILWRCKESLAPFLSNTLDTQHYTCRHRRCTRCTVEDVCIPQILARAALQVAVSRAGNFAAPALAVNPRSVVGEWKARAARTMVPAMDSWRRTSGAHYNCAGGRDPQIEWVPPPTRKSGLRDTVDWVIQVF